MILDEVIKVVNRRGMSKKKKKKKKGEREKEEEEEALGCNLLLI